MKKTIYSKPVHRRPKCETLLREWMDRTGTSVKGFARLLGRHPSHVKYYADGQQLPTLIDAFEIERLTGGKVPAVSWLATDIAATTKANYGIRNG